MLACTKEKRCSTAIERSLSSRHGHVGRGKEYYLIIERITFAWTVDHAATCTTCTRGVATTVRQMRRVMPSCHVTHHTACSTPGATLSKAMTTTLTVVCVLEVKEKRKRSSAFFLICLARFLLFFSALCLPRLSNTRVASVCMYDQRSTSRAQGGLVAQRALFCAFCQFLLSNRRAWKVCRT